MTRDRVNTFLLDQPHEMHRTLPAFRRAKSFEESVVGEKVSIGDRLVDPGKALIDDSSRTDIQVPDFAVALIPFGQTDGGAGRLHDRGGPVFLVGVGMRGVAGENGVGLFFVPFSPSVPNDQYQGAWFH